MNKRKELSLGQSIWFNSFGSTIYFGCQWLITILVVRLSPSYENAGDLSLAMSITNVFYAIALYSIRSYQISDINSKYRDGIYIASRIVTSIVAFIMCALFVLSSCYNFKKATIIILYMVFKISEALIDVFHGIIQKANRMDIVGKSFAIRGFLTIVVFIILMKFTKDLRIAIFGMCSVSFAGLIFYDVLNAKKICSISPVFSYKKNKKLLIECFPLVVATMFGTAIVSMPRYLLERYYGSEILGVFSTISTPTVIVQMSAVYVFNPMLPAYAKYYENRAFKEFKVLFLKTVSAIIVISAFAIIASILFGDLVMGVVFGDSILQYTYILLPALWCAVLTAFMWFIQGLLIVMRDFKGLIIANLAGIGFCLFFSPYLIKEYEMYGVTYIIIAALAISIVLMLFFSGLTFKRRFESERYL